MHKFIFALFVLIESVNANEPFVQINQVNVQQKESAEHWDTVGMNFALGRGVQQNYNQAVVYFERAVKENYPLAQYHLAVAYENGLGVKGNMYRAMELYTDAANAGQRDAQYTLAKLYENGIKVKQNKEIATYWYDQANKQNTTIAQKVVPPVTKEVKQNVMVAKKIIPPSSISAPVIPTPIVKKEEPLKKQKPLETAESDYLLGETYAHGKGVKQDYKEAYQYFLKSANKGSKKAQYALGLAYEKGLGVEKNIQTSLIWYKLAAEQ